MKERRLHDLPGVKDSQGTDPNSSAARLGVPAPAKPGILRRTPWLIAIALWAVIVAAVSWWFG